MRRNGRREAHAFALLCLDKRETSQPNSTREPRVRGGASFARVDESSLTQPRHLGRSLAVLQIKEDEWACLLDLQANA